MNRMIDKLKLCAEAHRLPFSLGEDDNEGRYAFISGLNIPTLADVKSIVEGFTGSGKAVEADWDWGCITVWLNRTPLLDDRDIDWMIINMAVPYKMN